MSKLTDLQKRNIADITVAVSQLSIPTEISNNANSTEIRLRHQQRQNDMGHLQDSLTELIESL